MITRAIAVTGSSGRRLWYPRYPRRVSEAGSKAGINLFRGQRCGRLRRGKDYGRAALAADPRHATGRSRGTGDNTFQALDKVGEALPQPASAFPCLGVSDCHCRCHT